MNFTTYTAFRTTVQTLIDGDDISQSELAVSTLDTIIALGELRIYRDLRSSTQDTALSLTVTDNVATLPSDFIELKTIYSSGSTPATFVPYEVMQGLIQNGSGVSNAPLRYTLEGETLIFYPMVSGTVLGRYYKRFADISTGVNALLNRHPDVFIYAALAESGPFIGEERRLPVWEAKYSALVQSANEYERRHATRGSKLSTRIA